MTHSKTNSNITSKLTSASIIKHVSGSVDDTARVGKTDIKFYSALSDGWYETLEL